MTQTDQMLVLARVIQDLAFLDLVGASDVPGVIDLAVAVDFRGPQQGTIVLGMPLTVAETMARNLLGLDPGVAVDAAMVVSAAGELANVVTGNTIPLITAPGAEIRLGVPRPVAFPHDADQVMHVETAEGVVSMAVIPGRMP